MDHLTDIRIGFYDLKCSSFNLFIDYILESYFTGEQPFQRQKKRDDVIKTLAGDVQAKRC